MIDYTLVVGVDAKHLAQLALTWPTWMRHKPSILLHPMIMFRDHEQVSEEEVRRVVDHPDLSVYAWPMGNVTYEGTPGDKWTDPQRYKMLAGFVHVPAMFCRSRFFLKLDTDVIATGHDDWIDPEWFADDPAIVSHGWNFTKPPDQVLKLDEWAATLPPGTFVNPPLGLMPKPGATRLTHKRIISWCGFFETGFCRQVAKLCNQSCGMHRLPVPSQDGVHFYCSMRMGREVKRISCKSRGWEHWHTQHNVRQAAERVMS